MPLTDRTERVNELARRRASDARERDIVTEHRHTEQVAGQPRKRGVNVSGRKGWYEDDRKHRDDTWHDGQHAVLDEKKMVGGKPSPRRGPIRPPE